MRFFQTIKFENLTKTYGDRQIISGSNGTLYGGKCTVLMGNNGAGKSTLLRLLAGINESDDGKIYYDGYERQKLQESKFRASVVLLSHEIQCYSDLTALENLRFFGKIYGIHSLEQKIEHWLTHFDLFSRAHHPIRTFSRGMMQRLALSRVFLVEPAFLLLDEPYTGLDENGVLALNKALSEKKSQGTIILLTTHDLKMTDGISDYHWAIQKGKLETRLGPILGTKNNA